MEKIKLEFSATPSLYPVNGVKVVMTLDETGKKYKARMKNSLAEIFNKLSGKKEKQPSIPSIPECVLEAFTENAIDQILSKDEIPNETGMMVLDGNSYDITITKGDKRKKYYADNVTIETYPLLRYLASWCGKLMSQNIKRLV